MNFKIENDEIYFTRQGEIAHPCCRLVWVRRREVKLRPREFNLLLYFMQNPDIVLTSEKICENAWGGGG